MPDPLPPPKYQTMGHGHPSHENGVPLESNYLQKPATISGLGRRVTMRAGLAQHLT